MQTEPSLDGILDFFPGAATIGPLYDALTTSLVALRNAAGTRDWERTRVEALHCQGFGHSSTQLIGATAQGESGRINALSDLLSRTGFLLDGLLDSDDDDLENVSEAVVAEFAKVSPDSAASFSTMIDHLVSGQKTGSELVDEMFGGVKSAALPPSFNLAAEAAVAAKLRGLITIYHSEFNLAWESISALSSETEPADLVDEVFTQRTAEFRSAFEAYLKQIQRDLEPTNGLEPLDSLAAMSSFLEREIPLMGRRLCRARLCVEELRAEGKGQHANKLGRRTAEASLLVREAFASYATSAILEIALRTPTPSKELGDFLSDASALPFDTTIPNGTDTRLANLSTVQKNKFIEVSGFVETSAVSRDSSGKLVSRLTLSDPASGATGDVVAVFVHLPHAGVTPGSFVRASGLFDSSPPGGGGPAVHVDVLSLAQLSSASFRVSFFRLAQRFFEVWRNGANLFWSVGPHELVDETNGVDETASSFGAGELLFLPFIR